MLQWLNVFFDRGNCVWKEDIEHHKFDTDCGNGYQFATGYENATIQYCPWCGREITLHVQTPNDGRWSIKPGVELHSAKNNGMAIEVTTAHVNKSD